MPAERRGRRLRPVGAWKSVALGEWAAAGCARQLRGARRCRVVRLPVVTVAVAEDYAAACRILNRAPEPPETDVLPPTRSPVAPGTGRHRKP
ncbi:DUF6087 family protein [Streptomyces sp. NPDC050636]|uniref:DUF6087 family protein n=1 Tax=Streptomyces sp. NPDC050636 TaxID=3154510 RepID=UPI00343732E1